MFLRKVLIFSTLVVSTALTPASAETIQGALAKAYKFNSTLNSTRAGVRGTDENVPLAKSGYRPTIGVTGNLSYESQRGRSAGTATFAGTPTGGVSRTLGTTRTAVASVGIQLNQTLFDGFQTRNTVRNAEANVRASRENLRNTEQNILAQAATAYMNVIRDRQIAALTEQNLAFLNEQVRSNRSRFDVGEGTRTDVAQAEAQRAEAIALLSSARAQVQVSAATYRQVIGDEPGKLSSAKALSKMLPKSLDGAQSIASSEHPGILASGHLIDAAVFAVKVNEGTLLPQLDATLGANRSYQNTDTTGDIWENQSGYSASAGLQLTIPLYQGGAAAARIRQAKEELGQARIDLDVNRDQVRQQLSSAWASYVAAREGVDANRSVVEAARLALNGVIEERNVGQRTTLDVLNAQSDVINAQISLVQDEHDVVVASYNILNTMGRLTAQRLGLDVKLYDPKEHYDAVKDKWMGLRTPDGR